MSDIALTWNGFSADFAIEANDLKTDAGLETAILLSLFLDREATTEELPPGETNRRGWWADTATDKIGSRLWLLARAPETDDTLRRAEEYAAEALQWMIEDTVAKSVNVSAEWLRAGVLGLSVIITKPDNVLSDFRFSRTWAAMETA